MLFNKKHLVQSNSNYRKHGTRQRLIVLRLTKGEIYNLKSKYNVIKIKINCINKDIIFLFSFKFD